MTARSRLLACLLLAGSCSRTDAPPVEPTARSEPAVDACAALVGARFESVELLDCGLGPEGVPALGHWNIEFDASHVRFTCTDMWLTATYTCRNGDIRGSLPRGEAVGGRYDAERGILIWLGHEYRRAGLD